MKTILTQINSDVRDIFDRKIETSDTYSVPSRDDPGLTFTVGEDKKGKILKTCVLMADMRNSTKISKQLSGDKKRLGKIYSAFIHAMALAADEFGYVRNIIGDRVMVVFEPKDCHINALKCAILMNTVVTKILAERVAMPEFKVGIGIDYGEMLVLKTGLQKRHEERSEYKNLVWVGDAANIASKLTDAATKEFTVERYRVKSEKRRYGLVRISPFRARPLADALFPTEEILTKEQVMEALSINFEGTGFGLLTRKITKIEKLPDSHETLPNILMTERVYDVLAKDHPEMIFRNASSKIHLWNSKYNRITHPIKDVDVKVYGASLRYDIDKIIQ
ncbi:adenylate/guanylate cyclase domain-containing protein [Parachryseolinea silvisoli]|uniref:adenylate/guanylate cyclase domain-containing protein n=1 Tax=Parachryseolinea silvisoli TaxID=2873601 RepID=UPI00226583FB|nr:adenylate/guanylate cyclase domain-containing protein [Parachryseolinea silvisoli]MCD9015481.1 adenylate/guanylate cyclase domain-containing protein [Parachryseolinea silvisoli]